MTPKGTLYLRYEHPTLGRVMSRVVYQFRDGKGSGNVEIGYTLLPPHENDRLLSTEMCIRHLDDIIKTVSRIVQIPEEDCLFSIEIFPRYIIENKS